ncbi:MAG TPA: VOC family protein [Candidatus Saccharimonadales bacterium]|nr:VOC family protein [Candidatus Saccharimonadales bacterium]
MTAFNTFSAKDLAAIKQFYSEVLGLEVEETPMGLEIHLPGGAKTGVYQSDDNQPAAYTMLNFIVEDIDEAVEALAERGVTFERYEGLNQDEKGIARGIAAHRGPDGAWFKDPQGNIIEVLQVA